MIIIDILSLQICWLYLLYYKIVLDPLIIKRENLKYSPKLPRQFMQKRVPIGQQSIGTFFGTDLFQLSICVIILKNI